MITLKAKGFPYRIPTKKVWTACLTRSKKFVGIRFSSRGRSISALFLTPIHETVGTA